MSSSGDLREGDGTPLQYSCLENPMDGGAWWAAVHGIAKSWTRLSDFTFTFHFHALEKEMATHSSVLAWRIPGTREPGGLPSMGSHRVRHDWSDLAAAAAAMITLYSRQQKRHRCIEQSFGLCGRGRGWDDLGEWHWNMYNIIYEMNHQSKRKTKTKNNGPVPNWEMSMSRLYIVTLLI